MHAGFVDMQYGAFVPRWKCQTFLTQLGKSGFSKDQIRLADTLFSLWTNQYPWILANPIYGHQALNSTTSPYVSMVTILFSSSRWNNWYTSLVKSRKAIAACVGSWYIRGTQGLFRTYWRSTSFGWTWCQVFIVIGQKENGFIDMIPIELHVTMTDAYLPPTWSQFPHQQNWSTIDMILPACSIGKKHTMNLEIWITCLISTPIILLWIRITVHVGTHFIVRSMSTRGSLLCQYSLWMMFRSKNKWLFWIDLYWWWSATWAVHNVHQQSGGTPREAIQDISHQWWHRMGKTMKRRRNQVILTCYMCITDWLWYYGSIFMASIDCKSITTGAGSPEMCSRRQGGTTCATSSKISSSYIPGEYGRIFHCMWYGCSRYLVAIETYCIWHHHHH